MRILLPVVLIFIIGCSTCPPKDKKPISITDEEATLCEKFCSDNTTQYYECPNNVITE